MIISSDCTTSRAKTFLPAQICIGLFFGVDSLEAFCNDANVCNLLVHEMFLTCPSISFGRSSRMFLCKRALRRSLTTILGTLVLDDRQYRVHLCNSLERDLGILAHHSSDIFLSLKYSRWYVVFMNKILICACVCHLESSLCSHMSDDTPLLICSKRLHYD